MEANQEMIKNKENVKNLLNLLQLAYKERDEAKNQLHKVLNKLHYYQPESPLVKANSSITESNSLSADNNNNNTFNTALGSPVVDSFFDAVSSPDFSSFNVGDSHNVDQCSLVIENIVKGKKLPEKGRLLQSVMEAGPLLQTLLVAGPLPRWRNPPPLQPFKVLPPVLINTPRMCSSSMLNFSTDSCCFNQNGLVSASPNSPTFGSQFYSIKRQRLH
ncbi:uncharacterized protein LOC120083342 isoform X2 [Benincasa hispida]|nr:uncharacterized protein LOC120083342 isoform X2 [Benincasa hispida]XP_038894991.1 uncharacterized protein LOC120083342 isoform X2 [Benincasa hispida]